MRLNGLFEFSRSIGIKNTEANGLTENSSTITRKNHPPNGVLCVGILLWNKSLKFLPYNYVHYQIGNPIY